MHHDKCGQPLAVGVLEHGLFFPFSHIIHFTLWRFGVLGAWIERFRSGAGELIRQMEQMEDARRRRECTNG
jgi:hypothetical protein